MPAFETPKPISLTIDLAVGDARLDADQRTETVVEVRPSDPDNDADAKAAERTRVEYANGKLLIKGPRRGPFGHGSVDVSIDLPSGSDVRGGGLSQRVTFRGSGRLGECRLKTSTGDIQLEETGPVHLATSYGDIAVERVEGPAEVATGSGTVRIRELAGPGLIKNSNGDSWVGEVTGRLRVNAANGAISVDKAHTAVEAKTANGDIRIGEVVRDSIVLGTATGQVEVGISPGTAALLDVRTRSGNVRNLMSAAEGPGSFDETVEVRASTTAGDVVIRRA
ncbi:DUF4097 family beta strand repeat-containing protein [Streptomyces sp. P1-3]|uniref:DUF4097 family beta strand repeat-containing protein n=1 Tax=Streptomyces sp. P1-3 TaxID=3421658 RepID=UPI003D35D946